MMARLVALIASIRPTVRRVMATPATAVMTTSKATPASSAVSIVRVSPSRSPIPCLTNTR
jgi:hypothetical protein